MQQEIKSAAAKTVSTEAADGSQRTKSVIQLAIKKKQDTTAENSSTLSSSAQASGTTLESSMSPPKMMKASDGASGQA